MKDRRTWYAPDGMVSEGWREVRKGGRVKFAGIWWQHDDLLPYVGQEVFCQNQDYWQQVCDFYPASERHKSFRINRA